MSRSVFVWGAACLMFASTLPGADNRQVDLPIETGRLGRLHVTRDGRVLANIPPAAGKAPEQGEPLETPEGQGNCNVISTHTSGSFEGGSYTLQAGFAQMEIAAAQYVVPAAAFPIKLDLFEMIFGTQATNISTTTEYTILIWEGSPATGNLIFQVSSDNELLPHIVIPPGTNGVNLQFSVDPGDPEQIIINDNGTHTFSIGVRVDRHQQQTQDPCFTAPPSNRNAFPATDNTVSPAPCGQFPQLQQPNRNWLFGVNCGPDGCPANGGWSTFAGLRPELNVLGECIPGTGCRPHGDWVMRATWSSLSCTPGVGACCFPDGTCQVLAVNDCTGLGGDYAGDGLDCASANCPQPTGGCCFANGSCIVLTASDCGVAQGTYVGDGTTCAAGSQCPLGACCLPDGTCVSLTSGQCSTQQGVFRGAGVSCANANCPPPTGACCLSTGGCIRVTMSDCGTIGGTFLGVGIACGAGSSCPTGACCFEDGTCMLLNSVACASAGGSFAGFGVSCNAAGCPQPTGACCLESGNCLVLARSDCLLIPGAAFAGPDTGCDACAPACAADFNQDGALDPDDLGDYINCYFANPACAGADFNSDGGVDPDDLGDFINAYFAGC
ncbi:MAG: hypothetical protein AB7K52_07455 [Phycisphaerales bacterium]